MRLPTVALLVASVGPALSQTAPPLIASTTPPSAPPADPAILDIVDVQASPIGGLNALAASLVLPDSVRLAGFDGTVVLTAVVAADGAVESAEIRRAPSEALGIAVRDAVLRIPFEPGRVSGQPVRSRVTFPVRFRFDTQPSAPALEPSQALSITAAAPIGGWERLTRNIVWPQEAFEAGAQGIVVVAFTVGEDGTLSDLRIVDAQIERNDGLLETQRPRYNLVQKQTMTPDERPTLMTARRALETAAMNAVRITSFVPKIVDGVAVASEVVYPVRFILEK